MIRVNLLPIKQQRRRKAGKAQIIIFVVLLASELAAMGMVYVTETTTLTALKNDVSRNTVAVTALKKDVQDADRLRKKEAQLIKQLGVLGQLEKQRSGPVRLLDELQSLLSPPINADVRHAQLKKDWNVEWDASRLWLEDFKEKGGEFKLTGGAVSADDVAEFLQRLTTADHFTGVELDFVQAASDKSSRLVDFSLTGKILYAGGAQASKSKGS